MAMGGEEEEEECYGGSMWLDLCMRAGRCLEKVGSGRTAGWWRWQEDYLVMVDVHVDDDKAIKRRRLVSGVGLLNLTYSGNDEERDMSIFRMTYGPKRGGQGKWGVTHAWPVEEEAIGRDEEEWGHLVDGNNGVLWVQMMVMLMDRRSGKMAVWLRRSASIRPSQLSQPGMEFNFPPRTSFVGPGVEQGVACGPKLAVVEREGGTRALQVSVDVRCSVGMYVRELRCLFDKLEWS